MNNHYFSLQEFTSTIFIFHSKKFQVVDNQNRIENLIRNHYFVKKLSDSKIGSFD